MKSAQGQACEDFERYIDSNHRAPAAPRAGSRTRVGILGGGSAGLTVAAHLDGGSEVLEGDGRPGGHCQSVCEEGFTFDAGGPHIIFSRNRSHAAISWCRCWAITSHRGRRNNKIFYKGRYVKYPFENGLYDLDPQDRFECLYHYLHNNHPQPVQFQGMDVPHFRHGTRPRNTCCRTTRRSGTSRPSEMSLDWVEGRVPKPPFEDVIKAAVGVEHRRLHPPALFLLPGSRRRSNRSRRAWRGVSATSAGIYRPQRSPQQRRLARHRRARAEQSMRAGFDGPDHRNGRPVRRSAAGNQGLRARAALQLAVHGNHRTLERPPARLQRHLRSRSRPVVSPAVVPGCFSPTMFRQASPSYRRKSPRTRRRHLGSG